MLQIQELSPELHEILKTIAQFSPILLIRRHGQTPFLWKGI